ncbi:barstar family protein [Chryseobacterium sp. BIGb0232]|uniref:barstar family protein n=1 Tax=Chryseobacterium sp. BIGb0232 TaxID=2940598 RepID=UPI000F4A1BFF|nr:barstar family protein [Chryseobacterium sp. BIGb0232]MCS4304932.1 RNAse (barnase) inhibitor barstar [Chryseobacterium sp. BIGb0232]ROS09648.1 barstar (barnase inhibitor) [Chryseobacterium nakagawai]
MTIELNNKYCGINYINLKRNENIIQDKLLLKIDKAYRQDILDQIEDDGKLSIYVESRNNITFCLYEIAFTTNWIYLLEEGDNIEEIFLEVIMSNHKSALSNSYNQFIVDTFYNWNNSIEIDWTKIKNLEIKGAYLKACYLWNHNIFEVKNINEVYIDGRSIESDEDLYYYLGEQLIGKRGYFGSNLDSLEDYLIDIVKNNEINTAIIFDNTDIIIKNTSKYYFETLVYLLEKAQFKIEIRE